MSQLLFKHLSIGDSFSFVEYDVHGERPVYERVGRNKYTHSEKGGTFYVGLRTPVTLVEPAKDRRYTELEEALIAALRECVDVMEGPLRGLLSVSSQLSIAKRALHKADTHFPAPKPPSPAPMHWTLPAKK